MNRIVLAGILALFLAAGCGRPAPAKEAAASRPGPGPLPAAFDLTIPGTTATLHFVPIPALPGAAHPFFLSASEVTWDAYDAFALHKDEPETRSADAITRPSKPYLPPDRGWGHAGYAAMSITFEGACRFCDWLSKKTGRRFRLPTETEWEHAARAGCKASWSCGDDEAALGDHAWYAANSDDVTHPVCRKKPNAWGLYDVHGNVAEWCVTAKLEPTTCGGSFRDDPPGLQCGARARPTPAWQKSDPQIPKSPWWLTDGPFVGFRIATDAP